MEMFFPIVMGWPGKVLGGMDPGVASVKSVPYVQQSQRQLAPRQTQQGQGWAHQ